MKPNKKRKQEKYRRESSGDSDKNGFIIIPASISTLNSTGSIFCFLLHAHTKHRDKEKVQNRNGERNSPTNSNNAVTLLCTPRRQDVTKHIWIWGC